MHPTDCFPTRRIRRPGVLYVLPGSGWAVTRGQLARLGDDATLGPRGRLGRVQ